MTFTGWFFFHRHTPPGRITAQTDAEGWASARFEHDYWVVRVIARADGRARSYTAWYAPDDQEREVVLPPEMIAHGRVVDDLGRPARGTPIVVDDREEARADDEGWFALRNLARGAEVEVKTPHAWHHIVVGDEEAVITVPSGGEIVIDGIGPGRIPPGDEWRCLLEERVHDRWFPVSGQLREGCKDRLTLRGLKPGQYRVSTIIPGVGFDTTSRIEGSTPVTIHRGAGDRMRIVAFPDPGRRVKGHIVDAEGSPVRGGLIRFGDDDPVSTATRVDERGRFLLRDMPFEDTWFHVSAPGFEAKWVPVVEGETDVGPIVLARARSE